MSKAAHKRLMKEYAAIKQNPPPYILAKPSEKNILEWHYVITGPSDSPYKDGEYHGKVVFPAEYPFKPPSIMILTPNGRFKQQTRLCLSMSDFHPESWNPAWSVASILTGLLSFMLEETSTTGSISTTANEKQILARQSYEWNRKFNPKFVELFPELLTKSYPNSGHLENGSNNSDNSDGVASPTSTNNKGQKTREDDVVMNEINAIIESNLFKMLFGGLVVYLFYILVQRTFM